MCQDVETFSQALKTIKTIFQIMVKITLITGEGKGKTTLSIGSIFQKQREGKSILVAQFLKTGVNCGECTYFENKEDGSHLEKKNFFIPRHKKRNIQL